MGRGRSRAMQRKIARDLKYDGGRVDLDRLRRDLGVGHGEDEGRADAKEHEVE
ncbi:hypothetical protein GCM10022221_65360 [Actinocorallia aurea]